MDSRATKFSSGTFKGAQSSGGHSLTSAAQGPPIVLGSVSQHKEELTPSVPPATAAVRNTRVSQAHAAEKLTL